MAQRDATADAPLEAEAARRAAFGWGDGLALLTTVVWAAFFPFPSPSWPRSIPSSSLRGASGSSGSAF